MNLPPLPEPSVWVELDEDQIGRPMWKAAHLSPDAIKGEHRRVPCVSVDQLRSYGESCARMAREEERERALRLCREQIAIYESKMDGAMDRDDSEQWDRSQNFKDALDNIAGWIESGQQSILDAAAIRKG